MAIAGPGGVDDAIAAASTSMAAPFLADAGALQRGDGPREQAARSGVKKSMRNRIVKTGAKHLIKTLEPTADRRWLGWLEGQGDRFFYS